MEPSAPHETPAAGGATKTPLDLELELGLQDDGRQYLRLINNCDEHDPLLSETPLGRWLARVPLSEVPASRLTPLNLALNLEQLIPTPLGLNRDYRGLAELLGFTGAELETIFKRSHNPTKCLLDLHVQRRVCLAGGGSRKLSVRDLLQLLERIERFDAIDDLLPALVELAQAAARRQREPEDRQLICKRPHEQLARPPPEPLAPSGGLQYDAFLCYAPEDQDYADELIMMLERHNKRIVTKENLLPGRFEYDSLVQMIANECRKVILILSGNFLHSRECEFQAKFANEIAIKSGLQSKVIPVLYEAFDDSRLPPLIQVISKIDMRANQPQWQLRKLLASLEFDGQLGDGAFGGPQSAWIEPAPRNSMHQPRRQQTSQQARSRHFVGAGPLDDTRLLRDESRCGPQGLTEIGTATAADHLEVEPIVDLAYSQASDSALNMSCHRLGIQMGGHVESGRHDSERDNIEQQAQRPAQVSRGDNSTNGLSPAPSGSNNHHQHPSQLNPFNWYRSFKRKVLTRGDSISPSTSSRAGLLQQLSSSSLSRGASPVLLVSGEELESEVLSHSQHSDGRDSSKQRSD